MASSSEDNTKTVKMTLQVAPVQEDFETLVNGLTFQEMDTHKTEIFEEIKRLTAQHVYLNELLEEENSRIRKEETVRRQRERNELVREQNRLERESNMTVFVDMAGFRDEPYTATLPKDSTIADLREMVAVNHPDYTNLRLKTAKDDFTKHFKLIWNDKVFHSMNARPTLGGKTVNMPDGARLSGYSKAEYEAMTVIASVAPVVAEAEGQ